VRAPCQRQNLRTRRSLALTPRGRTPGLRSGAPRIDLLLSVHARCAARKSPAACQTATPRARFDWPGGKSACHSTAGRPELADRRKDARVKAGPFESRRVDPLALPPYGGPHYVIGSGSWPCAGSCRRAGRLGCWASPLPGLRQLLTRQAPAAEVPVQTRGPSPARHASVNGLVLRLRTRTGRSRRRRGSARCT
jgi:hypothetical protein